MLKFKNLFANIELAEKIVKLWNCDSTEYFQHWRVSANAVYPFQFNEDIYYLRVAPQDEKEEDEILAEVDFLNYLIDCGFDTVKPICSTNGNFLEIVTTQWGTYYATVFLKAPGKSMEEITLNNHQLNLMGQSLGKLHRLSSAYLPKNHTKKNWNDVLNWVEADLLNRKDEEKARTELLRLRKFFNTLEITKENYGLIHYDFELDNVFFDTTNEKLTPIDFDDSMYHWYAMDIENTLSSIKSGGYDQSACDAFIQGYKTEWTFTKNDQEMLGAFKRFSNLYKHVRLLKATDEPLTDEPDWMINLRKKIETILIENRRIFGTDIVYQNNNFESGGCDGKK